MRLLLLGIWLGAAVFFGAVVIDIAYSRSLGASLPGKDALFRGVSDIMLQIGFLVFVSGCAAILAAWRERQAQVLFLVSVTVFIAFGFLLPIAFMQQLGAAGMGSALGPTIRISVNLLAAVFAILTRMTKPERETLDLSKKVRIYAGEAVEGFPENEIVRLRADALHLADGQVAGLEHQRLGGNVADLEGRE